MTKIDDEEGQSTLETIKKALRHGPSRVFLLGLIAWLIYLGLRMSGVITEDYHRFLFRFL